MKPCYSTVLILLTAAMHAAEPSASKEVGRGDWARWEFEVDGVRREAFVHVPAAKGVTKRPVVYVFHGHGGTARHAARTFAIEQHWPEAVVVCPQGLPTVGHITDPEGKKAGWQRFAGDQADRDLKFFDALHARVGKLEAFDATQVFSTGHSNGGAFTYLLGGERSEVFRALAPSAAAGGRTLARLKPKPILHLGGENDPLVRPAWQKRTIEVAREINGASGTGKPWGDGATWYESPQKPPVVSYLHPGGHQFPPEAPALIVKFFKEIASR